MTAGMFSWRQQWLGLPRIGSLDLRYPAPPPTACHTSQGGEGIIWTCLHGVGHGGARALHKGTWGRKKVCDKCGGVLHTTQKSVVGL